MTGARLVIPQTLKGFQDLLPEDMLARDRVVEKTRRVCEQYGFLPLDTPILEYLVTLMGTGGDETNKQLFRLESPEREPIAMRFDLTVPFARLIAQYPEKLKLPFRRYHIGPVFRADKPDAGRFRQFTQFDIDAAGCESVGVDAEIVAWMCDVMRGLGLSNYEAQGAFIQEFQVRINNRKLVDALLEACGITDTETHKHVLRVVDKLQKVGVENLRRELSDGRVDESGAPIRGVGLSTDVIDRILAFVGSAEGGSRRQVLERVAQHLPHSEASEMALREMRDLAAALESLRVPEHDAVFAPSLARGLDYYTGPVFEALLPLAPGVGSVMGGGRYDDLVQRFALTRIPATGVSIGLDRLMSALTEMGRTERAATTTVVLVVSTPSIAVTELLSIAAELRVEDIPTEVYFGEAETSLSEQFSFANARGIPIAVILGEEEMNRGEVSVKDLRAGIEKRRGIEDREQYRRAGRVGQTTVERSKIVETVRSLIEREAR